MSKYKVGDRVRVLPFEIISKRFDGMRARRLPSGVCFSQEMELTCETEGLITYVYPEDLWHFSESDEPIGVYKIEGYGWTYTDEMLEAVDEVSTPMDISISLDDLLR